MLLVSLVPRPRPSVRERRLGTSVNFLVCFKSCDTCLCKCAFQQPARDRKLHCLVPRGGVWVAVTRECERDICVTSEILQSDWTLPIELQCQENRLKFPDRLSVCGRGGLDTRLSTGSVVKPIRQLKIYVYIYIYTYLNSQSAGKKTYLFCILQVWSSMIHQIDKRQ